MFENELTSTDTVVRLLRNIEDFSALEQATLELIAETADYRHVDRGEVLIQQGDEADMLYIVLKGRFVVLAGSSPIAEIGMGEPIGELAFFAGGRRTASVVAGRNSVVMCLSRDAYDALAAETPSLSRGILAALSQRLARTISVSPELRPKAGKVCSVFPAVDHAMSPAFLDGLKAAFASVEGWSVLDERDYPEELWGDTAALTRWLEDAETRLGSLLLLCADPDGHPTWRVVSASNSDTILLAAPTRRDHDESSAPSALERLLMAATLPSNIQLALYRPERRHPTTDTARWLRERPVALHHHVALDSPEDFDRLARFIRGEAVGLVLCGGGSYGTAHLGAIKSLSERGHVFDFVGGTSVGSAMAGALAIGLDPDDVMDLCDDVFIKSKAMSRLTVPKYSVLDHRRLDQALSRHFGGFDIEDTPLNFFAVATSLTDNDVRTIRRGPLWQSIRASTSLPGVFPPFITDDGEVLIDGGLLDNVPVNIMRELKPGPNVILNFLAGRPWRVQANYEDLPGRRGALRLLLPGNKSTAPRFPTVFSVLSRAMVVNARKLLEQTEIGDDVLLNISILKGMSFLDWSKGRQLFDAAYAQMSRALDVLPRPADGGDGAAQLERLRQAAEQVNSA